MDDLALSDEGTVELEVVLGFTAFGLELLDEVLVALEVGIGDWVWSGLVLEGLDVGWEGGLDGSLDLHSVGEFLLEGLVVLDGGIGHDLVVEVVELGISLVNGEVVSLLDIGGLLQLTELLLTEGFDLFPETSGVLSNVAIEGTLEISDWLRGEGELTPLENVGLVGLGLDGLELLLERLGVDVGGIGILHPVNGEEITEA